MERIVEYVKPQEKSPSNTLGAVATALGGTALAGVVGNTVANMVSRYANNGQAAGAVVTPPAAAVFQPAALAAPMASVFSGNGNGCGCYVTKEESGLIREISSKDSEIAKLKAEKYADEKVQEAVDKVVAKYDAQISLLNNKVCNLETHAAVNATSFEDYKQFANRVFVHQPKAHMRNCIVTTENDCCCCSTQTAPAI